MRSSVETAIVALALTQAACSGPENSASRPSAEQGPIAKCVERTLVSNAEQGGNKLSVSAKVLNLKSCVAPIDGYFWGSTDIPPKEVIGALAISLNGSRIPAPVSAFVDLGDPSSLAVRAVNTDWVIEIRGVGDSAYLAKITVKEMQVRARDVFYPGFDPNKIFERTTYDEWAN
jgi:hypothetical protein